MTEGTIYKFIIDPLLSGLRKATAEIIPEGKNIIDVACGTGALAFELSKKAHQITAIDASESMVKTAHNTKIKFGYSNIDFKVADATQLSQFENTEFDLATISLAIHQFNTYTGLKILEELKRISKEILIVDYACPLPPNYYRHFIWFIERLAGGAHYENFKIYQGSGGIENYLDKLKINTLKKSTKGKSVFSLVLCG
ncbi:MAG: methyltransferase domain-containing protein [Bacteroidales bacterium]|jgi:ubiquinone/menaquinone biosynthesis C-methylase UbiE|nr:methyltransferase domain-containing protein [Bacteroidales bacterium]